MLERNGVRSRQPWIVDVLAMHAWGVVPFPCSDWLVPLLIPPNQLSLDSHLPLVIIEHFHENEKKGLILMIIATAYGKVFSCRCI